MGTIHPREEKAREEAWAELRRVLERVGLITSNSSPSPEEAHLLAAWSALRILGQGNRAVHEMSSEQVLAVMELVRGVINVTRSRLPGVGRHILPPGQIGQ